MTDVNVNNPGQQGGGGGGWAVAVVVLIVVVVLLFLYFGVFRTAAPEVETNGFDINIPEQVDVNIGTQNQEGGE